MARDVSNNSSSHLLKPQDNARTSAPVRPSGAARTDRVNLSLKRNRVSSNNNTDDDDEQQTWIQYIFNLMLRCGFIAFGVYLMIKEEIYKHLMNPSKLNYYSYMLGTISYVIFFVTLAFVLVWKHIVMRRGLDFRRWRSHTPRSIQILTVSSLFGTMFYCKAFMPVMGHLWAPIKICTCSFCLSMILSFF